MNCKVLMHKLGEKANTKYVLEERGWGAGWSGAGHAPAAWSGAAAAPEGSGEGDRPLCPRQPHQKGF